MNYESTIKVGSGILGILTTYFFGGWSEALSVLGFLVVADYLSGIAASIREGSGLNSNKGFWGILKKFSMFAVIAILHRADIMLGLDGSLSLMVGAIFFYIANELISLAENYGRLGWPMPEQLKKLITVIKDKQINAKEDSLK